MDEARETQQTKILLENFNRIDEAVQAKLINGVKSLAFLYSLTDSDDAEKEPIPARRQILS